MPSLIVLCFAVTPKCEAESSEEETDADTHADSDADLRSLGETSGRHC